MARKFLYIIAALIGLVVIGGIAFQLAPVPILRFALVPSGAFVPPPATGRPDYTMPAMWLARPDMPAANNPALWRPRVADTASYGPDDVVPPPPRLPAAAVSATPPRDRAAIFFIHPTSYLSRAHWNAPLDDSDANWRAGLFTRGMASVFADSGDVWAPRYRQAAVGAFLTRDVETANRALLVAYDDVAAAFDQFLIEIGPDRPIILAGHSQGSLHLTRLLRDRVANRPLAQRMVAAYTVGWPVSVDHDLPRMGLPACAAPGDSGCIIGWQSYAEPADTDMVMDVYNQTIGFDGQSRAGSRMLCVNPVSGVIDGTAPRTANLGTVTVDEGLADGDLRPGLVGARCDDAARNGGRDAAVDAGRDAGPDDGRGGHGFLLVGPEPFVSPYILPGNNMHVFDYPLFWMNVRADVARRLTAYRAR